MSTAMMVYLAWQEDDWLDEILDRFSEVRAMVPNAKTFRLLKEEKDSQQIDRYVVIVLNAAYEQEECRQFLQQWEADGRSAHDSLYIVGLKPDEQESWQRAYPQANIIVITGFAVEFDYDSVLSQMESDLEGSR
ncbi:hypothetical protein I532_14393 [Brevibacillus borstelensis AK1]|uniref:Uncharacterized protein n=1 Tax=Brevibacillus borstelensis AK1 TaxID=1300222 RepID=M8E989_9BACL|nr:hypothetical protein [Brevibacillus borstelensis]EMT52040.1 hypothetical protein I532_14393 [Brevibacillus borstelensis AK1]